MLVQFMFVNNPFLGVMNTYTRDRLPVGRVTANFSYIFNTTTNQHEYWDGAAWQTWAGGGGSTSIDLGLLAARPVAPVVDMMYYATDTLQLFIWTVAGGAWTEITPRGVFS